MSFVKRLLARFKHHHNIEIVDDHLVCTKCKKTFQIPKFPAPISFPIAMFIRFSDGDTYMCTDLFTNRVPIWKKLD